MLLYSVLYKNAWGTVSMYKPMRLSHGHSASALAVASRRTNLDIASSCALGRVCTNFGMTVQCILKRRMQDAIAWNVYHASVLSQQASRPSKVFPKRLVVANLCTCTDHRIDRRSASFTQWCVHPDTELDPILKLHPRYKGSSNLDPKC